MLCRLLNEKVFVEGPNYFYYGVLEEVEDGWLTLVDAFVIYQTGPHEEPNWLDARPLPDKVFINLSQVVIVTKWKQAVGP